MSAINFKKGHRVLVGEGCVYAGWEVTVRDVSDNGWVDFRTDNGESCEGHDSHVFKLVTKTLDNLSVDDVLLDGNDEYTVEAVMGRLVFLSDNRGYIAANDGCWTIKQLKDAGYTLKGAEPEPELTEVTLEEVAKLKGVPVEQIRIKDNEAK